MQAQHHAGDLIEATEQLCALDRPTLIAWAAEDRLMPPEHGRRLAELMLRARLRRTVELFDRCKGQDTSCAQTPIQGHK